MLNRLVIVLFFLLVLLPAHGQEEALTYLEAISKEYESVVRSQWQYARSVLEGNDYENEKSDLLHSINEAEMRIRAIPPYRNDKSLKDSVLLFLRLNKNMIREDYTRLADLQNLESQTFEELDEFLYAQQKAYQRVSRLALNLRREEEKFAKKYGIRLVNRDDRLAKRLEKLNKLFSYYNTIYMAFYKAYSQELIVFKSIQGRQPTAISRHLSILSQYADKGIQEVRKEGGFQGDKRLFAAALNSLTFYKREATQDLVTVLAYYQKLNRLDELREERKKGGQNAEEYNALVREINAAGNQLNEITEALNEERARLLQEWNEASSNFLALQVP